MTGAAGAPRESETLWDMGGRGPDGRAAQSPPPCPLPHPSPGVGRPGLCIPIPCPISASQLHIPAPYPGSTSRFPAPPLIPPPYPSFVPWAHIPIPHPSSTSQLPIPNLHLRSPSRRPLLVPPGTARLRDPPTLTGGTTEAPAPPGTRDPPGGSPRSASRASAGDIPAAAMETWDAVALATETIWVPAPPLPAAARGARSRGGTVPGDTRGDSAGLEGSPCPRPEEHQGGQELPRGGSPGGSRPSTGAAGPPSALPEWPPGPGLTGVPTTSLRSSRGGHRVEGPGRAGCEPPAAGARWDPSTPIPVLPVHGPWVSRGVPHSPEVAGRLPGGAGRGAHPERRDGRRSPRERRRQRGPPGARRCRPGEAAPAAPAPPRAPPTSPPPREHRPPHGDEHTSSRSGRNTVREPHLDPPAAAPTAPPGSTRSPWSSRSVSEPQTGAFHPPKPHLQHQ